MKLMLDTNVFLRWMNDRPLPRTVERLLTKQSTELVVSIVTGWEIVMKPKLQRNAAEIEAGIQEMGAILLPVKFKHLNEFSNLPFREDHKDPFDRMLIAQALAEDLSIATSDTRFAGYKGLRTLWD
jgi:PIN domain nuclease of toxin-antitoxin system